MLELIPHLLEHAFEDTIYLVPFLLVTYFLLEALEHKAGNRTEELVQKAGKLGPAVAAVLGAIPQCGFSAAGAALFSSRAITLGTLFAVLLSTSDEMLPLFIAEQVDWHVMAGIVGVKVAIGMIMGFAIDGVLRFRLHLAQTKATQEHNHEHARFCNCKHEHAEDHAFGPDHCHNPSCHCASAHTGWTEIAVSAVKHTLEVSIIVFLISLALVAVMEVAGEEAVATFLASNPGLAIFGSALVGLIPNCGASGTLMACWARAPCFLACWCLQEWVSWCSSAKIVASGKTWQSSLDCMPRALHGGSCSKRWASPLCSCYSPALSHSRISGS